MREEPERSEHTTHDAQDNGPPKVPAPRQNAPAALAPARGLPAKGLGMMKHISETPIWPNVQTSAACDTLGRPRI